MKILYITQCLPYPAVSGGPIKTLATLKALAKKGHEIYLVCFVSRPGFEKAKLWLERHYCEKVAVVVSGLPFATFSRLKQSLWKNLFSWQPFIARRYCDLKFEKKVKKFLAKKAIEAIHIDHLNMATYLPKEKTCLWVWEEHNLESELNWQIAKKEKWNRFKLFCFWEAVRLNFYERRMIKKFDVCLAISNEDMRKIEKVKRPTAEIKVLPLAVKAEQCFSFGKEKVVLFVGLLPWWPNKSGLRWFYEKIWPEIRKKIPQGQLWVVGKGASGQIKSWAKIDPSLKLLGFVKDITAIFKKASVFVVPITSGTGIRVKVLTSLARGVPVVTTNKGKEGLLGKTSDAFLIADDEAVFAREVVRILSKRKLAEKFSLAGIEYVKKYYSQQAGESVLETIYGR